SIATIGSRSVTVCEDENVSVPGPVCVTYCTPLYVYVLPTAPVTLALTGEPPCVIVTDSGLTLDTGANCTFEPLGRFGLRAVVNPLISSTLIVVLVWFPSAIVLPEKDALYA